MKILLVDDDDKFATLRSMVLRNSGYEVDTAASLDEARSRLMASEYDVALLDQNLEGDGGGPVGLELIKEVHAACPWASVIMVSGYWQAEGAVKRAFDLGAIDYLVKGRHLSVILAAKLQLLERDLVEHRRATMTTDGREQSIRTIWLDLQTETNPQTKGKLLEALLAHLLRSISGFRDVRANVENTVEEIDLIAAAAHDGPWHAHGPYWLVECKNWNQPVPRKELDVMLKKMERCHGRCRVGVMVAWSGVTEPFQRVAQAEKDLIIALERKHVAAWVSTADRGALLQRWVDGAVLGTAPVTL